MTLAMGGFVYLAKASPAEPLASLQQRHRASLDAMRAKRLPLAHVIDRPDFGLFVYGKRNEPTTPIATFPRDGFVVGVGTLLYRRHMGSVALAGLYQDSDRAPDLVEHLIGSFAVLVYKHGTLRLFNDYHGIYAVFADPGRRVVSSSFLATLASVKQPRISDQEVYEYLFDGATYGGLTPVVGIRRLDPSAIHQLVPAPSRIPKRVGAPDMPRTFAQHVEVATGRLLEIMRSLRHGFGDQILVSLSGGYDSRLLLAAALRAQIRPRAFVGGPAGSADVVVAKQVARAARIEVEHQDRTRHAVPPPDAFSVVAHELFHYCDGLGTRGAVGLGAEFAFRAARLGGGLIELNGGGGEIYRDFWKLPAWPRTPISFATKVLLFKNLGKLGAVTGRFQRDAYLAALEAKLRRAIRPQAAVMSCAQVASLYTVLRSECFAGPSNKEMNLLGYSMLPFAQPQLTQGAHALPLRHRASGHLEAAMIRHLDPTLAAVPSVYGYDFSKPPPFCRQIGEALQRYARDVVPLGIVSFFHRRAKAGGTGGSPPDELSSRHVDALCGARRLRIRDYVDLERVRELGDRDFLSRALTLEMLFRVLERD